jgi:lipopolysaccharide export system permease protein
MMNWLFPHIFEKYLAKQIYIAFVFILFSLMSLFVFFDFLNEVNSIRGNYSNVLAFLNILLKAPNRLVEIIPIAGLIGGIYVFAMMASQSEFTILRMAGLDIPKGIKTLLKIGLPVIVMTLALSEWVGPYCEGVATQMKSKALGNELGTSFKTGTWVKDKLQDPDGKGPIRAGVRYVNVSSLKSSDEILGIRMYEFDENRNLLAIRIADSGSYDKKGYWNLEGVTETSFNEIKSNNPLDGKYTSSTKRFDHIQLSSEVTPDILNVLMISPEKMSIVSLFRFINHLEENKQEGQSYKIALWKKMIYPLTILVMLTLALPFGYLNARSGGISLKIFGGIMLGMSFQLTNTLFSHVGLLGSWPAAMTAIIPPAAFFIMGLVGLYWVSRK